MTVGDKLFGAAAEITRLRAEAAELRSVMIAAAEEIQAHWTAHCDAEGYGPANLMRRLEDGIPSQYAYTAGDFERLRAEAEALRKDAARLDWLQTAADARKIELAKSLFGRGYEIGEWPSMRVTVKIGTLRDAIDAAIDATKGTT